MKKYGITGWNYIISEKLKNSIEKRVWERASGIVVVPSDIIKRVHKENIDNYQIDSFGEYEQLNIKSFCIYCYCGRYEAEELNKEVVKYEKA